jgi:hypothetical protein
LKNLSIKLTEKFGKGYSVDNLQNMRRFYSVYSSTQIQQTLSAKLEIENSICETPSSEFYIIENQVDNATINLKFTLSWSHYIILMRIENQLERRFYEIESKNQN